MISGNGDIIAHLVHHTDDRLTLGQKAHGLALYGVAVVHQQHMAALALKLLFDRHQSHIPETLIHAAVDVAGEQHHHILLKLGVILRLREGPARRQQRQRNQQPSNSIQHFLPHPFHFIPSFALNTVYGQ